MRNEKRFWTAGRARAIGGGVLLVLVLNLWMVWRSAAFAAPAGSSRASYVLPAQYVKNGVVFAETQVPLNREDVADRVVDQINYLLMDRRAGVMEWFDRMVAYGQVVKPILNEEKVPEDMFYLAAILSDLDPNARPKAGGVGWWALGAVKEKKAPADIQWVATNEWDDRRDPAISTRVACNLFQWLHRRRQTKDWLLTICAFIEGADKIDAAAAKTPGFSYWDVVMPPRCDVIVPRLVALKIIDSNRELYGVAVAPTAPMEYDSLDRLKLLKELPLHVAARWCRTSPRSMWELNPGVDPASGFLPKPDKRSPAGYPFRAPKGMGNKVRQLLIKEGYLAG